MTASARILSATIVVLALAPRPARAQAPMYVTPAPRYVYTTPAPRYVYVQPARRSFLAPRYAYTAPVQQRMYVPAVRTYYTPATPFGRYRQAVDSGRDPNWATGRGVPVYKPWEY